MHITIRVDAIRSCEIKREREREEERQRDLEWDRDESIQEEDSSCVKESETDQG